MSGDFLSKLTKLDQQLYRVINWEQFCQYLKANMGFLLFVLLASVLAFAYDLFHFSLRVDSELEAFTSPPWAVWLNEGRWGVYFLSLLLMPTPVLPVLPTLIAITGMTIGVAFFVRVLLAERELAHYLAAAILVSSPLLYFIYYYQALGYAYGIAVACIGAGFYFLTQWTKTGFVISVVLFCLALSVYQALLFVIIVIYGIYSLNQIIESKYKSISRLFILSTVFILSVLFAYIAYDLITEIILSYYGKVRSGYIQNFNNFELSWDYLSSVSQKSFANLMPYYLGHERYYLDRQAILQVLFVLSLLVVLGRIAFAATDNKMKMVAIGVLFFTLITPGLMLLLNKGVMPARTMTSVAFVNAGILFIACRTSSPSLRLVFIALTVACFFKFTVVNHRYSLSSHLAWQEDRAFAQELLSAMNRVKHKLPEKDWVHMKRADVLTKRYPLEIVGVKQRRPQSPVLVRREIIGSSVHNWAGTEVRRLVGFLSVLGNYDYWPATRSTRKTLIAEVLQMPIWPADGSVDVIQGAMVIKLGDYDPEQLAELCPPNSDDVACQELRRAQE